MNYLAFYVHVNIFFCVSLTIFPPFSRFEADGQLEAMFSGVRVIDIQGCCVRLSLKTYIPNIDKILLRHKLDFVEPPMSEHEMLVEFSERNMDIKSMEVDLLL